MSNVIVHNLLYALALSYVLCPAHLISHMVVSICTDIMYFQYCYGLMVYRVIEVAMNMVSMSKLAYVCPLLQVQILCHWYRWNS